MKKKYFIFLLILFISLFSNVFSQKSVTLPNVSSIYNPSLTTLHPRYKIYHKADDVSTVYSYFYLPELNFVRLNNDTYKAKLQVNYMFYESLEKTTILDSASKIIEFEKKYIKESVITYFDVSIPVNKCKLVIITKDLYNNNKSLTIIDVDKTPESSQNFLLMDSESFKPVFTEYVKPNRPYKAKYHKQEDSVLIIKYKPDSLTAAAPFSSLKIESSLIIDYQFYLNKLDDFSIQKKGIYKLKDEKSGSTYSIYNFGENYPEMKTAEEMILPLKYICTSKEYKDLTKEINKKLALDNFWLSTNDDPAVARSLIKIYYNRVLYSNIQFTTTREGWKTDRGMIYVVFGPPEILHIGDNYEEWIYVDGFSDRELVFIFEKKANPLSDNDYVLQRNIDYKQHWKEAVDTWRNGNLYIF